MLKLLFWQNSPDHLLVRKGKWVYIPAQIEHAVENNVIRCCNPATENVLKRIERKIGSGR